ncbi:MAG: DUF2059 domain-containing protein [Granulosicoccus sp.]
MNCLNCVRRSCLALVTVGMLITTAQAQDAALLEAAKEYVKLPGVQKMIDDNFAPEWFAGQMATSFPPAMGVTQDQLDELGKLMADKMSPLRPEMELAMINGAANHFTLDEIKVLSEFYQSPEGASVMAKMQPYMRDTMAVIMPKMMQASQELGPQINRILGLDK